MVGTRRQGDDVQAFISLVTCILIPNRSFFFLNFFLFFIPVIRDHLFISTSLTDILFSTASDAFSFLLTFGQGVFTKGPREREGIRLGFKKRATCCGFTGKKFRNFWTEGFVEDIAG